MLDAGQTSPSPELILELRNQLFEEIMRLSDLAVSYSHSIGEAAYRGDHTTVIVHMRQLRECLLRMFETQKDFLRRSGKDTRGNP